MNLAIMQPYFLPYIGYFQLIAAVDKFVIYDTVKYTKKGWINRNRMLLNGLPDTFSLPLRKDSDTLNVVDRYISEDFDGRKILDRFESAYRKAPEFHRVMPLLSKILEFEERNLFRFIQHSINCCCAYMNIQTPIVTSSKIEGGTDKKGVERVLDICAKTGATCYINPIGGVDLYQPSLFLSRGIGLRFLQSRSTPYQQFGEAFQPNLTIVDVMMFNPMEKVSALLAADFDLHVGRDGSDVSLA